MKSKPGSSRHSGAAKRLSAVLAGSGSGAGPPAMRRIVPAHRSTIWLDSDAWATIILAGSVNHWAATWPSVCTMSLASSPPFGCTSSRARGSM